MLLCFAHTTAVPPPIHGRKNPQMIFFYSGFSHSDHVDMILITFAQAGTGRKPLQGFTEEMVIILIILSSSSSPRLSSFPEIVLILITIIKVTVDRLRDDHCPNQLLPSLQLPSLVSNSIESKSKYLFSIWKNIDLLKIKHKVTNQDQDHCKRIHMEWGHLMEARDR